MIFVLALDEESVNPFGTAAYPLSPTRSWVLSDSHAETSGRVAVPWVRSRSDIYIYMYLLTELFVRVYIYIYVH